MPPLLQPLLFAGPGAALYPLLEAPGASKCALPLLNRPLVAYALQALCSAGLRSASLFVRAREHAAVKQALAAVQLVGSDGLLGVATRDGAAPHRDASADVFSLELLPLGPHDKAAGVASVAGEMRDTESPGTAELVRWYGSLGRIEADLLILPIDFLAPSSTVLELVAAHLNASAAAEGAPGASVVLYERGAGEGLGKDREKEGPAKLLSAYSSTAFSTSQGLHLSAASTSASPASHSLLLLSDASQVDTLTLRRSLLSHSPRVKLSTNLLDAHLYILAREPLLELLQARHELTSLREHVLPLLARASWQTGLLEKALDAEEQNEAPAEEAQDDMSAKWHKEAVTRSTVLLVDAKERLAASAAAPAGSSKKLAARLRTQVLVIRLAKEGSGEPGAAAKEGTEFAARANTVPTFLECTRFLQRQQTAPSSSYVLPHLPSAAPTQASAQISSDTHLAANVSLGERCTIKRSVIGAGCVIGRGARLTGCVLLDGVKVGENARLENTIVAARAKIGDRCTLKDCDVAPDAVVAADASKKVEKILHDDDDEEGEEEEGGGE